MSEHLDRGVAAVAVVTAALSGAALFRLRGSSFFFAIISRGATTARIVAWALPMAMIALGGFPGYITFSFVAFAFWLGGIAPWWQSISMGRVRESKDRFIPGWIARAWPSLDEFLLEEGWCRDAFVNQLRGMLWVLPPAIAMAICGVGWEPMVLAGLLCAPSYEIGWRVSPKHATEIGEAIFGSVVGAAAALS